MMPVILVIEVSFSCPGSGKDLEVWSALEYRGDECKVGQLHKR